MGAEMRNVVLVLALLLALSATNASAEDLSAFKLDDSTRTALQHYDEILLPEDRERIESL